MDESTFQMAVAPGTAIEEAGFAESMEMLRQARSSFAKMCRLITQESGIRTIPSFEPDQADWCGGNGTAPDDVDWTIRVGFGKSVPARVIGMYDELCMEWLKGPESFHDWVGALVLDAARESRDGDYSDEHEPLVDEPEDLPEPAAKAVAEARIGLVACGYVLSPAAVPENMGTCSFVAWRGDTLVFVAVTDEDDAPTRSEALAREIRRWNDEERKTPVDVAGLVVRVDGGHLSPTDVEL